MSKSITFITLAFLLVLSGCETKEATEENPSEIAYGKVFIEGAITNYDPQKIGDIVYIQKGDFLEGSWIDKQLAIDSTGSFSATLDVFDKEEILIYSATSLRLLVSPNDTLKLDIDGAKLSASELTDAIQISGSNTAINEQLVEFRMGDTLINNEFYSNVQAMPVSEYISFQDSILTAREAYVSSFLNRKDLLDETKQWLFFEEKLYRKNEMIRYPLTYRMFTGMEPELPEDYVNEMTNIPEISEEYFVNSNLTNDFVRGYVDRMRIKLFKENGGVEVATRDSLILQSILRLNNDNPAFAKRCLYQYANSFLNSNNTTFYESHRNEIDGLLAGSMLGERLTSKFDAVTEILNNPVLPEKTEILAFETQDESKYLDEIIANANGKVIYIDNWATWCGPCKVEFKESTPQLKEKFADDVEFVYLCYQSEEKLWKPTISQFQIEGKHYFIPKGTGEQIKARVGLTGYPTYTIINKKGEIVHSGFEYRPSEAITTEILNELIAE